MTTDDDQIEFNELTLTSWSEITEAVDALMRHGWVFRGQSDVRWLPKTSLERELGAHGADSEQRMLWHFVRTAPRFLPSHLVPHDSDAAAWLGLIQHYGGPTRLLDVSRSPYVALFFAFEANAQTDRALWGFNAVWCATECARAMATLEGKSVEEMYARASAAQSQIMYSLVHRQPYPGDSFASFKPFTGVFPLDPWKPDIRQGAQQAMFLCAANTAVGFVDNLGAHDRGPDEKAACRLVLPVGLREEVLDRLSTMNVTAATLFPDLGGIARSLRTHTVHRARNVRVFLPWERAPKPEAGGGPGEN